MPAKRSLDAAKLRKELARAVEARGGIIYEQTQVTGFKPGSLITPGGELRAKRAIVLAGGQGTRLRSVIDGLPKPMAPVAGRPFLAHLLDRLERRGVERVVLSVGYLSESIVAAFGTRYRGLEIAYSVEETPLGTGGGLRQALDLAGGFPVFALNGDTIVELDYAAMWRARETAGTALALAGALRIANADPPAARPHA